MSTQRLLHSKKLILLYKEGKLDKILKRFKSEISEKNFMGAGTHASSYRYKGGKQVFKLCPKDIPYFHQFPLVSPNRSHAKQFKQHIGTLAPFLSEVKEILYEDEYIFIYTQDVCRRFDMNKITVEMVVNIFRTVRFLIQNNLLLGDIAPNNFGFQGKQLVLFDYHDLQPISRDGRQLKTGWWRGIMKNLTRYLAALYAPQKLQKYERLMDNLDEMVLEKLHKDGLLPSDFIRLLQYILIDRDDVSEAEVCQFLTDCIYQLRTK